jgi:UDP-N-acetylmuramoyl-L-alanyl-D-glutamate--2,6-diaminopimelate ligase
VKISLGELVQGLGATLEGDPSTMLSGIASDSRRVQSGDLFVALRGAVTDGHRYLEDAVAAGAAALLVEGSARSPLPVAHVPDARLALAEIAARFYGHPARELVLVGVTGTSGKTSTVRMLESVLHESGRRAASIGTISVRYPGTERAAALTTPDSLDLQRTLREIRDAGVDAVAMEVSSHSLVMERVRGVRFQAGVFTNLSHDHLDFHKDLESYAEAKGRLFTRAYLEGSAVLHASDPHAGAYAATARASGRNVVTFARVGASGADYRSQRERVTLEGSSFELQAPDGRYPIELPLPGDFQIENALAAAAAARALGLGWDGILRGLASCPPVPGRLERVSPGRPAVFVDYAHKPAALEAVLASLRPQVRGRLIAVFGCGGDRDPSKRAPMARAACRHADLVIATSDNPRTEDPDAILREISRGLSGVHRIVPDRREAIHAAIALADADDVVLIAGKGHEDYQIVGQTKRPFDDREVAREALRARGAAA